MSSRLDPSRSNCAPEPQTTQNAWPESNPAPSAMPVVEVDGLGKVYGKGDAAVQDVRLTVRAGEFVTLLGPSGCGKSTLLRMLAGLAQPSRGRIRWWGADLEAAQRDAKTLAFVFQEPTLMPWRKVAANVRLPLSLAGARDGQADVRVQEVLKLVGLEGCEAAYPRELSGGMQMRASIARALVTDPDLLLMDEPFGALDEITRSKLNSDLLHLWALKHWTVVFVTHSIYEAVYLSTHVAVMSARPGRIIEEIRVSEPYPRLSSFRTSARFAEYCSRLAAALDKTTQEPPQ